MTIQESVDGISFKHSDNYLFIPHVQLEMMGVDGLVARLQAWKIQNRIGDKKKGGG